MDGIHIEEHRRGIHHLAITISESSINGEVLRLLAGNLRQFRLAAVAESDGGTHKRGGVFVAHRAKQRLILVRGIEASEEMVVGSGSKLTLCLRPRLQVAQNGNDTRGLVAFLANLPLEGGAIAGTRHLAQVLDGIAAQLRGEVGGTRVADGSLAAEGLNPHIVPCVVVQACELRACRPQHVAVGGGGNIVDGVVAHPVVCGAGNGSP